MFGVPGADRMSSSQRLLFRLFAVVAALVLVGGRVERLGQRSSSGETASFGEAARTFVIQSAKTDVFRGQGQFPRAASGLAPGAWARLERSIQRPNGTLVPIEPCESAGVRARRRILRMESDEPPLAATADVRRA
jgi:hypothetical protein